MLLLGVVFSAHNHDTADSASHKRQRCGDDADSSTDCGADSADELHVGGNGSTAVLRGDVDAVDAGGLDSDGEAFPWGRMHMHSHTVHNRCSWCLYGSCCHSLPCSCG